MFLGPSRFTGRSFEVGLHHALHTKSRRDSMQFIELQAFAAPRLRQRFERYVETNLVPESKAVRNRAGDAVDANGLPLDAMLLEAKVEHRRRAIHLGGRFGPTRIRINSVLSYVCAKVDAQRGRKGGSGRQALRSGSRHLGFAARRAVPRSVVEAAQVR